MNSSSTMIQINSPSNVGRDTEVDRNPMSLTAHAKVAVEITLKIQIGKGTSTHRKGQ